jgi:hypothetical protein
MRNILSRSFALLTTLLLVLASGWHTAVSQQAKDKARDRDKDAPQLPVDVYEWSIWVGNPAQTTVNTSRVYRNAMPGVVGTIRPKFEDKDVATKFPIAPVSVVQFFGKSARDVDVDLRAKKGMFLAHWPAAKEYPGRLTWFGAEFTEKAPSGIPQSYFPPTHWLAQLRANESALYLKTESHFERFIAYDTELPLAIPVRIRGGPDEYTLQNMTNRKLLDVAVIAPAESGFRVGWLDELPTAVPEKPEEPVLKKPPDAKEKAAQQKKKADALFQEAEKKTKEEEIPPLPAEGDATVRARVDQLLNQPVTVVVQQAPRRDVLGVILRQARLRYELDEPTLAKEKINLGEPMNMQAQRVAARDALADVLGNLGLSYRVTEDSKLFITTAARLAEDTSKKGAVIEGPPVKVGMSQPRKADDSSYRQLTHDTLARRLAGQGLREDVVELLLKQYGKLLFEPGELLVLAHLSRETLDETVLLDVFPPPKKFVRTALVVIHGVDPRLQDRARVLVKRLGDKSPKEREAAETRLFQMGPVAVPVLEDALTDKDIEIVFRAERLLLKMNRPVQ